MAALISPGVDVSIIDQSYYIPGQQACVPLIFIATADEKLQDDGVTPAEGTYEYGVIRTVTSISQSLELYGTPRFLQDIAGNQHHGDARNEYGLDALNKYLEVGNRAYVIRANVNLNDNLSDTKDLWERKIQDAADYLSVLVADYITQYNEENNLIPADAGYKSSVNATELKTLLDESLTSTLASYSFSSDEFEVAFIQDHTIAHPGYQDVLFDTSGGFLQLSDITGLISTTAYSAQVQITSGSGTNTYTLTFLGSQAVTFGQLVTGINNIIGAAGTCQLLNGRLRITSSLDGVTSAVQIIVDGPSGFAPLFSSLNLYSETASPVDGVGIATLDIYDDTYSLIVGQYEGVDALIDNWTGGTVISDEFTAAEAEGLLLALAADFDNTKEFKNYTSLGANDAARRTAIVRQLQAMINNPNTGARDEWREYNVAVCPGYDETADELVRLSQDQFEEVFVIGETPFDKPPTGPLGISTWSTTPNRATSYHAGYFYPHGLSSNIDGANIMTSAASTALRVFAYSDSVTDVFWAPAGTTRGVCPHLTDIGYVDGVLGGPTTFKSEYLDRGMRDELYEFPKNINPITFIPGRGILVLGQKTTSPVISALDRINVSRLVKLIKRQLRKGLYSYLFEPNDKITRDNVKATVDGFLSDLVDRRALYDYASFCDESNNTAARIDRNELWIDVAIKPVKSIEFIYVPVRLVATGANIGGRNITVG